MSRVPVPDLKGWDITIDEQSMGVYCAVLRKQNHVFASITGTDVEELVEKCIEAAHDMERQIKSPDD